MKNSIKIITLGNPKGPPPKYGANEEAILGNNKLSGNPILAIGVRGIKQHKNFLWPWRLCVVFKQLFGTSTNSGARLLLTKAPSLLKFSKFYLEHHV